jgi:hypothetical protein
VQWEAVPLLKYTLKAGMAILSVHSLCLIKWPLAPPVYHSYCSQVGYPKHSREEWGESRQQVVFSSQKYHVADLLSKKGKLISFKISRRTLQLVLFLDPRRYRSLVLLLCPTSPHALLISGKTCPSNLCNKWELNSI